MKTMQKGFTLIELMIVVAIIGILAAIAVPAYQDYTIKSKVSESASMAAAGRTAIDVAYSEGFAPGTFPSQASLGLAASGSYVSKYVASVTTTAAGLVEIVMQPSNSTTGLPSTPAVGGGTVTYTPTVRGGNLSWAATCTWGTKYCPKN